MLETDLEKIRLLAKKNEEQNWNFRSWLKFNAPKDIDRIVAELSQKYSKLIDCKECGNCCRSLEIELTDRDIQMLARTSGQTPEEFAKQYTNVDEYQGRYLLSPCPKLHGNICSIYDQRPTTCKSYPHLEKPDFVSRLAGVIGNTAICPIVFNAFEELKIMLRWDCETEEEW